MTNAAGRVTMFAATDQALLQCVPYNGTIAPTTPLSSPSNVPPGIRWSIDHWARWVKAPVATRIASAAKSPLSRNANAERTWHHLEPCGRRPHLLAVQLDRQGPGGIDGDTPRPQQLDLRMREVRPVIDLRRGRCEVGLVDVPDEHHSQDNLVWL